MKKLLGKWLKNCIKAYVDGENIPQVRMLYRQFSCKHEFKVLDSENGGQILIISDNSHIIEDPAGKVYVVPEGSNIGEVLVQALVERKLERK